MKTKGAFLFVLSLITLGTFAQIKEVSQTIRGRVLDLETKSPLIGVGLGLYKDSTLLKGGQSDASGSFRFDKVPPGRYNLSASYVGYQRIWIPNIIVGSGKEVIQDLLMSEIVMKVNEVVVKAYRAGEVRNDMATISSKLFSVEETERYAGSRGDPARMAANFAGVQGADDTRNDIVVRGNSPAGVVYRIEGIDIFNPNHFSIPGTTGGSVSILNNKYLGKSDFFTGAFPAEYGNGTAAVFDLFMRNGNNEKREHSAQIGVLGTEVFTEGPINKETKSSYLFSYRYSSLALFQMVHFNFGTNAVPYYQDAAFRLNFPMKKNANLSFFGIGGNSHIDINISNQEKPVSNDLYGANDRDQYFKTGLGVLGTTFSKTLGPKTFTRVTMALQGSSVVALHKYVYRRLDANNRYIVDSVKPMLGYEYAENKVCLAWMINHKINTKWLVKGGFNIEQNFMDFRDSIMEIDTSKANYAKWSKRWDAGNNPFLIRAFVQFKYKPTEQLTINGGIHNQMFTLTNSLSLFEPRLGMQYQLGQKQSISMGIGLHSQTQNPYLYFYRLTKPDGSTLPPHNLNLGFTKSFQYVMGYDRMVGPNLHFHAEAYYQYLFNVPVEKRISSFSFLNAGSGFSRLFPDTLENKGTGRNYGLEFTLDRAFRNRYFYMITLSLFDAKYKGSDGVLRNTEFNGRYALNVLGTKEWLHKSRNIFSVGVKLTMVGGRWYGPPDTIQTMQQKEVVFNDTQRNTIQFRDYFRFDIKTKYVINRPKASHEIGIDIVNVFNTKNALKLTYSPSPTNPNQGQILQENQLGMLPLVYYRVDF